MRATTFLLLMLFFTNFIVAQNGDEITDAVLCPDATPIIAEHVSDATTASSTSAPECVSGGIDAFYYNTISSGDNKITVSMETNYGVDTTIHYQILRAPAGDIMSLQEVICSSFDVVVGLPPLTPGGSFSNEIITNVNANDVFYLRVYKPTGLAAPAIEALFNATTVEMTSVEDATLSYKEFYTSTIKVINGVNNLEILNNSIFNGFNIYNINGQLIAHSKQNSVVSKIDIASFNSGIYILSLNSDNVKDKAVYKFMK
ncbi:T9SS type A sorting domain-containing protein [Algibacter pectinivorans]|uniref:Por secretion system C-terminal sorting domain-containing protein n=1 Tax=Algibacter pectinivorans TaxID=870482 RepID=A0A1I1RHZ6_9FLAO|nr:T9SS type A sorting domain-containing protein [Algibacter pectinivorans]SFD33921.1 Por secretion system C-terminal sorting domain-containing protein [Algibacter pectinivorans]